jgi:small subunit ribosomal protein S21
VLLEAVVPDLLDVPPGHDPALARDHRKRFRKNVVKSAVLSTVRRKRWFVSKSEQRRMEKKKAIRRIKRRTFTRDGE